MLPDFKMLNISKLRKMSTKINNVRVNYRGNQENAQSRDIGHTRHRTKKEKQSKNTTQHLKLKRCTTLTM
jgi:glucosamine 6-phosphate synthetase-like amidotransferase/phosphosugar isomerase protein